MWIYPEIKTLADVPTYYAKQKGGEKVFLLADRSITYKEWERESNRIANALIERKIPRYSRISFIGKNSEYFFYIWFGVMKAGQAFLPLNWRLAPAELAAVVKDAGIPLVFATYEYKETIEKIKESCDHEFEVVFFNSEDRRSTALENWIGSVDDGRPQVNIQLEDTSIQLYTSGTTGMPKGVELTFGSHTFWFLKLDLEPSLSFWESDVMLFVAPNFHLLALNYGMAALYNGSKLSVVPEVRIELMIEAIRRDKVSALALAPIMIESLLNAPNRQPYDFDSLRFILYAGSSISPDLLARAVKEMKCDFLQFYGSTESGGGFTLLPPEDHNKVEKLKSCGRALPYVEIKTIDINGRETGVGKPGEVVARVPTIFKQYFKQPELTAEVLKDGWYHTGDVAYRDEAGYYYIVDRTKDMIISGGENIYSIEVEQALLKHSAVQNAAVIGVPHEKWGEAVKALVILREGESATADELLTHCRSLIAGYKIPKSIEFVDSFPLSPAGKILKTALRKVHGSV
ncbi:MAG: AMP-binding protein [Desulfobacterales bacterium]|jgi:acyl-CoA synthetase (AMP-forming)/AMP-acid ligase II|nr:AMP-binding protein [Desulfobacterales bacterium]